MLRIGFAGVPGAGKTSTARGIASICRRVDGLKNIELSAEYARRYIAKYGSIEQVWEQFRILKKQLDWEETTGDVDLLLTDAPVFMTMIYAQQLSKGTRKDTMLINDLFAEMNKLNCPSPRYDIIFHLEPVIKPVEDGVRPKCNFDPKWRAETDSNIKAMFSIFRPRLFHPVKAVDMDDRIAECMTVIDELLNCNRVSVDGISYVMFIEANCVVHRCDDHGRAMCGCPVSGTLHEQITDGKKCPTCFSDGV